MKKHHFDDGATLELTIYAVPLLFRAASIGSNIRCSTARMESVSLATTTKNRKGTIATMGAARSPTSFQRLSD